MLSWGLFQLTVGFASVCPFPVSFRLLMKKKEHWRQRASAELPKPLTLPLTWLLSHPRFQNSPGRTSGETLPRALCTSGYKMWPLPGHRFPARRWGCVTHSAPDRARLDVAHFLVICYRLARACLINCSRAFGGIRS